MDILKTWYPSLADTAFSAQLLPCVSFGKNRSPQVCVLEFAHAVCKEQNYLYIFQKLCVQRIRRATIKEDQKLSINCPHSGIYWIRKFTKKILSLML